MPVNLKSLIEKLNEQTRSALEAAAGLCVARTHYEVEIEHYLMKLLDFTDNDFARIAHHYGVDTSQLSKELTRSLDKMRRGNARGPALSHWLVRMLTEAWTIGTLDFNAGQIRSGFTILALRTNDELARLINEVSREFQKIPGEDLRKNFSAIVAGSHEDAIAPMRETTAAGPARAAAPGKTPYLDQYTIDLTERARQGKLDPVLGRDFEIRQIIDILMRRRQNNPILTARRAWARPRWWRASRCVWRKAMCPRRCVTSASARWIWHYCKPRRHQGRIREPAQRPDRGGQGLAHAHHPFH
jgi:type VI secretion system protein VasG